MALLKSTYREAIHDTPKVNFFTMRCLQMNITATRPYSSGELFVVLKIVTSMKAEIKKKV